VGALWQWPAPPPGANPFQKGNSGGLASLLSFSVASLGTTVLAVPTIAAAVGSLWYDWLGYLSVVVGLATGLLVLQIGIAQGGRVLDRRWPEALQSVSERSA
jgi:ABC-2 type transport system permease protein